MKPLLASIVLLLLALCRPSASGPSWSVVSKNTMSSTSSIGYARSDSSIKDNMKKTISKELKKEVTVEDVLKLVDALGGNLLMLGGLGEGLERVPHLRDALVNGMYCDSIDPKFKKELNAAMAGIISRADMEKHVDCAKKPSDPDDLLAHDCFCNDKENDPVFCFVKVSSDKWKGEGKAKTCPVDALNNLKKAGTGALGRVYDMDGFGSSKFEKEFGGADAGTVSNNEDAELAKVFCDATKKEVEDAVKEVYAADGLYWIVESALYSIVFGDPKETITETCAKAHYQTNEYGRCVCKQDTGYTFCIYKVFGEAFIKAGYLSCEDDAPEKKVFVKEKKAAVVMPQLVKASSFSTTASSQLMMVPLAMAAALLARL